MRWHNGRSRRSRNLCWGNAFKGSDSKKDEGAAHFHSGQEIATPTKAGYIRAGQFCLPHFSLAKRRRTIHSPTVSQITPTRPQIPTFPIGVNQPPTFDRGPHVPLLLV